MNHCPCLARFDAQADYRVSDSVAPLDESALADGIRDQRIIGDGMARIAVGHMLLTLFYCRTHRRGRVHAMLISADIVSAPLGIIFLVADQWVVAAGLRPWAAAQAPSSLGNALFACYGKPTILTHA